MYDFFSIYRYYIFEYYYCHLQLILIGRDKAKIMNCDYQKLYRNHLIRTYELELEAILREKYLMINSVVEF